MQNPNEENLKMPPKDMQVDLSKLKSHLLFLDLHNISDVNSSQVNIYI